MANYLLRSAHRNHPCTDSGGRRRTHAVLRSMCRQADRFFSHCRLTMQPPQSYSIGGQCSSRAATGKPAGARPNDRGRWCAVSRGHPDRPNPPSPRATLGQLCAAPWELPSSIGKGIAWIRTRDLQAIERILHSRGVLLLDAPLWNPLHRAPLRNRVAKKCAPRDTYDSPRAVQQSHSRARPITGTCPGPDARECLA
ncbi:UNVERIFIED_CONTAM: hypothetical protein FKN15_023994 [Acipenser sinensis]